MLKYDDWSDDELQRRADDEIELDEMRKVREALPEAFRDQHMLNAITKIAKGSRTSFLEAGHLVISSLHDSAKDETERLGPELAERDKRTHDRLEAILQDLTEPNR